MKIYTDGACTKAGSGGWAFVCVRDGDVVFTHSGGMRKTTNNQMELIAFIEAVKHALRHYKSEKVIVVLSDSQYVVRGANTWLSGWKSNRWRTSKRKPVANEGLWRQIDALLSSWRDKGHVPLSIKWVRGHNGDYFNEVADKLAKEGCP